MKRGNRVIPGGLELRMLDTDQFKDLLHWRLTRTEAAAETPAESQRFYLHAETGMDYIKQFLAEEKRRDRKGKVSWVQLRGDNHLLDCEVYAAACADPEWMPSFQMIANHMQQTAATRQKKAKPPSKKIDLW